MTKIKIVNKSKHPFPKYAKLGDSGMDLYANLESTIKLKPLERTVIPTEIYVDIPEGYEIQIRPRSGNSIKYGINVFLGTIDSGYVGSLGVIISNLSNDILEIPDGFRIAQMVLVKVEKIELEEVSVINKSTERGDSGYGSSD